MCMKTYCVPFGLCPPLFLQELSNRLSKLNDLKGKNGVKNTSK